MESSPKLVRVGRTGPLLRLLALFRRALPRREYLETELAGRLEEYLLVESNAALQSGALFAGLLAGLSLFLVPLVMWLGLAKDLWVPWILIVLLALSCAAIWQLARKRLILGRAGKAVMLGFVQLPTLFFLICHAALPGGAATYLTGPFSYVYCVQLAVVGYLFSFRFSALCSALVAIGYSACVVLAMPQLASIRAADPALEQDLGTPAIYFLKAVILFFAGITVGALSLVAKRLVGRAVSEERQKLRIRTLASQYAGGQVMQALLENPRLEAGQRQQVAVLFSDIRGFTEFGETAQPEQIVARLNAWFDAAVHAIDARGGMVDKFIGDAVMAVFGGIARLDQPCAAAVEAALAMRAELDALNAAWKAEGRAPLGVGVGVHFGDVVQGAIGSADRKDFTVIGDAVNTASRVEGLTKQYGEVVLITAEVFARLPEALRARCRPLGAAQVKGRKAALEVYGVG